MGKRVTLLVSLYSFWIVMPTVVDAGEEVVKLVQNTKPAVVLIQTFDANSQPIGQGSGFFIDSKGSIITNHHVIEGAYSATIKTSTGKEYSVHGIIAKDADADIIKLSVNITDSNISFLKLSTSIPAEGQDVIVIGNPLGLESSVSTGIISSVRDIPDFGKILQITAAVSAGSSGSPVLNSNGEVIGIATFIFTEGQALNFAIPSEKILTLKREEKIIELSAFANTATSEEEDEAEKLYKLGWQKVLAEKWTEALDYFQLIIKQKPNHKGALFSLGFVYYRLGRHEKAIDAYKQAIAIKPDDADNYYFLGEAYFELGRFEDAIQAYKSAIAINPYDADTHYSLGFTYYAMGDINSASDEYSILKNLNEELAAQLYDQLTLTSEIGTLATSEDVDTTVPHLYHNSRGHFSFVLPAGWEEIPKDVIDLSFKLLHEQSLQQLTLEHDSDIAFQKKSETYFSCPYIMFQVKQDGLWPESELKKYLFSNEAEESLQEGILEVENKLPNLIQNSKIGQTVYDKNRNAIFIKAESQVTGTGKVSWITAIMLSNYGSVNIYCYSTKNDFENDLPYFTQIINSFRYDVGYEYNQFTKKSGNPASESLWGIGLIAFICVGLVVLVIIIVRKSSIRSNCLPETLQASVQPSTSDPLSSLGEEATQMVLASSWQRFGTMLLDVIFYYIFAFILGVVLYSIGLGDLIQNTNDNILGIIIIIVYYVPQEAFFGRTLGKLITGTKAVNEDGTNLTFGRALGRTLCRFIPFEAFSFLGGKGRPKGWHDRIPKTKVISLRKTSKVVAPNSGIL